MKAMEDFLILCVLQTVALSVILIILVGAVHMISRRRTGMLIFSGLSGLILVWILAFLPFSGWNNQAWMETLVQPDVGSRVLLEESDLPDQPATDKPGSVGITNLDDAYMHPAASPPSDQSALSKIMAVAGEQIGELPPGELAASSSFPARFWLACLVLFAIGLGLCRLIFSWLHIRGMNSNARPLTDQNVHELLDTVRAKLSCGRTIQLRESDCTGAAFTIGWRHPQVFLSRQWRSWKSRELEATLAHEVAHICQSDFARRLIAQLAVSLNYYNPLVHWLCRQLCLDQEYKADATAARAMGDPQGYLNALAAIALQNNDSNHRLAPMFLPTRKSFFRRIEMLRSKNLDNSETMFGKLFSLVLVGIVVASVAGFRFPEPKMLAAGEVTAQEDSTDSNLHYVPHDADAIVVMRLARLMKIDLMRQAYEQFRSANQTRNQFDEMFEDMFAMNAGNIDQLTAVFTNVSSGSEPTLIWIAQPTGDSWWSQGDLDANMKSKLVATPENSFRGHRIYVSEKPAMRASYIAPDDKTLICVMGSSGSNGNLERSLKSVIRSKNGPSGDWLKAWQKVADRELACVVLNDVIDVTQHETSRAGNNPFSPLMNPLLESLNFIVASAQMKGGKTDLEATLDCATGTDMKSTKDALIGMAALAKAIINQSTATMKETEMLELPLVLLSGLQMRIESNRIIASTQLTAQQEKLLQPLIPAIARTRAAALRVDSLNRIRQLSLGMHNYHSAHGHFPPPVLISEHGKEYSWRVALLPYLDLNHLYERYRFDEEWDSAHNRLLTAQTPHLFQHPLASAEKSENCSYFVISGKETPFHGNEGTKIERFLDGLSNTFMIVEAKKDVHWAEPRDIQFLNGRVDTKLGGFSVGGYCASCCDGSTRFWSDQIDEKNISRLIRHQDGKVFDWSDVEGANR